MPSIAGINSALAPVTNIPNITDDTTINDTNNNKTAAATTQIINSYEKLDVCDNGNYDRLDTLANGDGQNIIINGVTNGTEEGASSSKDNSNSKTTNSIDESNSCHVSKNQEADASTKVTKSNQETDKSAADSNGMANEDNNNTENTNPDDNTEQNNSRSEHMKALAKIAQEHKLPIDDLHCLQTSWSLWLYTNNKSKAWEDNLQHVISFRTVEEFWAVYNHIEMASRLQAGLDYALFRSGTRPAWEDTANKTGGRWIVNLNSRNYRKTHLDRLWLEVMLLIIGEDFDTTEESSLVVGAVVSIRFKDDRIAIWTTDASQQQNQMNIGYQIKRRLGLPDVNFNYEAHQDQNGPKHRRGARYVV